MLSYHLISHWCRLEPWDTFENVNFSLQMDTYLIGSAQISKMILKGPCSHNQLNKIFLSVIIHVHVSYIFGLRASWKIALPNKFPSQNKETGRGIWIGSEFAWHASGPEFDPHVRHILSWRLGHENISTAILPLPLIQEEQLSVTGERMCTKYW